MAKLNWRFHLEKSSLWVRVFSQKYYSQSKSSRNQANPISCSPTWATIKKGEAIFKKGSKWIARRVCRLSLWFDKWLEKGTLRSLISGPLNKVKEKIRLKHVASFFGWNLENIFYSFSTPILLEMMATPLPFPNQGEDRISWHYWPSGEFKLIDAYRLIIKEEEYMSKPSFGGAWVWKILSLPKVKCFLWKCCYSSISVQALLNERGMDIPLACPMCNAESETIIHALRDCSIAQRFWNSFSPPIHSSLFYGQQLVDWLKINYRSSRPNGVSNIEWSIVFPMEIWILWLHRNSTVFGKITYLSINGKLAPIHTKIQVKWVPPPMN